jgi:hypothetical protein
MIHGDAPDGVTGADGVGGGGGKGFDGGFGGDGGRAARAVGDFSLEVVDVFFEAVEAEVLALVVGGESGDFGADLAGGELGLSRGGDQRTEESASDGCWEVVAG